MSDPTTQTYQISGNNLSSPLTLTYSELEQFALTNNLQLRILIAMTTGEDKRKTYSGYSISVVNNA